MKEATVLALRHVLKVSQRTKRMVSAVGSFGIGFSWIEPQTDTSVSGLFSFQAGRCGALGRTLDFAGPLFRSKLDVLLDGNIEQWS